MYEILILKHPEHFERLLLLYREAETSTIINS